MEENSKRTEDATRGNDMWVYIEKVVPEVSTSTAIQEMRTLRTAAWFSKQPANVDPIQNRTPKTPNAPKVAWKKAPAPDTGNYTVLESNQLDNTMPACQARETGKQPFDSYQRPKWYQFPTTHELLSGPRLHLSNSVSLTLLPALACKITSDTANSGMPGPLHPFREWYIGRNFTSSIMADQRSAWWVK